MIVLIFVVTCCFSALKQNQKEGGWLVIG